MPPYNEVSDAVLSLWQEQQRQFANEQAYERLFAGYQIEQVEPELTAGTTP